MKLYGAPTPPKDEDDAGTLLASLASSRPSPATERRYAEAEREARARLDSAVTPGARAAAMKQLDDLFVRRGVQRRAGMR